MTQNVITVTVEDDQARLALTGGHEAFSAEKLARSVAALLEEGLPVTVDLRQAEFLDSTVMSTLLDAARAAEGRGLALTLLLGSDTGWPVRRLLDVTGLAARFVVVG